MKFEEPQLEQPNIFKLRELASNFKSIFAEKPNLVTFEEPGKTLVIGDIHGDLTALKLIFKMAEAFQCGRIVLLGDYVDRGPKQLATLEYIIKMAIQYPDNVIPLRGNHEEETQNSIYGFYTELKTHFKGFFQDAIDYCHELYNFLPLAAQTPTSFFLHGGIPQDTSFKDFLHLPKPHDNFENLQTKQSMKLQRIFGEIRWNDPDETLVEEEFKPSSRGGFAKDFSCRAAEFFLRRVVERRRLFRSHEGSRGGFHSLWKDLVVHILTSDPDFYKTGPNTIGTVALEKEDGSVEIYNLQSKKVVSLPPRMWSGHSVCD